MKMQLRRMVKFDEVERIFIDVPEWCGGHGLAPRNNPIKEEALPERRPGEKVETDGGEGVEVLRHNCQSGNWFREGLLVGGIFYRPQ